jgi:hypothetical protein
MNTGGSIAALLGGMLLSKLASEGNGDSAKPAQFPTVDPKAGADIKSDPIVGSMLDNQVAINQRLDDEQGTVAKDAIAALGKPTTFRNINDYMQNKPRGDEAEAPGEWSTEALTGEEPRNAPKGPDASEEFLQTLDPNTHETISRVDLFNRNAGDAFKSVYDMPYDLTDRFMKYLHDPSQRVKKR